MKKILLASTALILSGGMAAAQGLSIGGQGRMGIQYSNAGFVTGGGQIPVGTSNYRTEARLQLNFAATVQADHGLTFGAFSRVRIQTNNASGMTGYAAGSTNEFSGARVWAEAAGFRLTFGNQDGAITTHGTAMGYLGGCGIGYEGGQQCGDSVGLLGAVTWFNSRGATGVNAGGQQTIHASYTMGDFGGAISTERGRGVAIAARGRFDAITVAAGYQSARNGSARVATASAHYNGGDWGVGLIVARIAAGAPAVTNASLSANVALGGGNLYGYVGRVGGTGAYGISYGYGLGGGASIVAGAERVTGTTTASVGVVFNF